MKGKIIAIGIIGMFFLISVTYVSTAGMNINVSDGYFVPESKTTIQNNGDPDFVICKIILEYKYGGKLGDRVAINVVVDNIGGPVEGIEVLLRFSFEGYPDFTTNHSMWYEGTGCQDFGNYWPGLKRPGNGGVYTLVVEVDPDCEIIELNDENNVKTKTVIFLTRNILLPNTFFIRFLERFPNAFPILRQILF